MSDSYYNMDDIMDKLDDIDKKIDTLTMYIKEDKQLVFKVVATKDNDKKPVADYIFDEMKEAILFQKQMVEKGYAVEFNRKWI